MINNSLFEKYAIQSTKVDRFFNLTNAYAMNHENFKLFFKRYRDLYIHFYNSNIEKPDIITDFFSSTYFLVEMILATNLYNDNDPCNLGSISNDIQIYSYIVCYCYQWNLFECFVSNLLNDLIRSNKLKIQDTKKLISCKYKTKKMLDALKIILKENPFEHILPFIHPNGKTKFQSIGFTELDTIRKKKK